MLYLLHGQNFKESRKKLHSLIEGLLSREPNASEFRVDNDNFSPNLLEEMISSQTLFAGRYIVVMDKVLDGKENQEIILKKLKEISKSENIFIFIEEKLNKTIISRFEKWAEKVQNFSSLEVKNQEKFKIFSLTDALGRGDKRNLWVLYQKALGEGIPAEEIHGIISWQIKNILMIKDDKNPKDLGLNPFVLRKTLTFAEKFEKAKLIKLSESLVEIPHNSRRGIEEFDVSLEKFILSL